VVYHPSAQRSNLSDLSSVQLRYLVTGHEINIGYKTVYSAYTRKLA